MLPKPTWCKLQEKIVFVFINPTAKKDSLINFWGLLRNIQNKTLYALLQQSIKVRSHNFNLFHLIQELLNNASRFCVSPPFDYWWFSLRMMQNVSAQHFINIINNFINVVSVKVIFQHPKRSVYLLIMKKNMLHTINFI